VIIALFLEWGMDKMIKSLDGEFAFAIFDTFENKTTGKTTVNLYLGRDRFGIRPLFYVETDTYFMFCSEMKGLIDYAGDNVDISPPNVSPIVSPNLSPINSVSPTKNKSKMNTVNVFQPRTWMHVCLFETVFEPTLFQAIPLRVKRICSKRTSYYELEDNLYINQKPLESIFETVRSTFQKAVVSRLMSEREIGCLLSGGLDSSLVASIASAHLKKHGRKLKTFSIGMKNSPDSYYAEKVAKHIDSIHTNVEIPIDTWFDTIEKIVEITETYDVTTIRATTGQYLISKWISENTNIKVLLIGDGSDELTGGYLYFHNYPSYEIFHHENIRLLENIHYFDVLRADRGVASNGLEARVPFLDKTFVETYLSIDPSLRVPNVEKDVNKNKKIEKWLLRKSFDGLDILPPDVLWRKKEAFSDGVSSKEKSWYQIIQENVDSFVSDDEYKDLVSLTPFPEKCTKEGLWYYSIFVKLFSKQNTVCPYYWLPKWVGNVIDPSARTLNLYDE
jgi:asparagine synthase (glutamine-hydrolysing)